MADPSPRSRRPRRIGATLLLALVAALILVALHLVTSPRDSAQRRVEAEVMDRQEDAAYEQAEASARQQKTAETP